MNKLSLTFLAVIAATGALAQFNGLKTSARVFNDFTTSNLTITNSNSIPGTATIDDRNMTDDGMGGNWANRHDVLLSTDNGATAYTGNIATGFTISARVRLTCGTNSPRKEAGIRINSGVTGDTLFIINSDAGEIVAFDGGAPFKLFGNNNLGNGYTPGNTILMGITYTPGVPGTLEYFIDRGAGIETSGPLFYSNNEGGPVDYQVGVYGQGSPSSAADFINAAYTEINASIPDNSEAKDAASYVVTNGFEIGGDLASLATSDDNYLSIFPDESSLIARIEVTSLPTSLSFPSQLKVICEHSVGRPGLAVQFGLKNKNTNNFDPFSGGVAPTADTTTELVTTNLNYLQNSGRMVMSATWSPVNDEDPAQDGWPHYLDLVTYRFTP